MPAKVTLQVASGALAGTNYEFDAHDTFFFGRHPDCRASLPVDPLVSRHHFILEVNPPEVRLRDLGSRNGTFVNDVRHGGREADETPEQGAARRFPEVALQQGDRIRVGNTEIVIHVHVPPRCGRCGEELSAAEAAARTPRCKACVDLAKWTGSAPSPGMLSTLTPGQHDESRARLLETAFDRVICQQCGRDVPTAAGGGRQGRIVCADCRTSLIGGGAGAQQLLQDALKNLGSSNPRIDGYDILGRLGEGAMGVVYKALRRSDSAEVAIKLMLAKVAVDERSQRLFGREIDVMRQLEHPHVVRLHQHHAEGGAFYFVMELCNGGSIETWRKRFGTVLPAKYVPALMIQSLKALQFAHERKFVHRDLKPENLLMHEIAGQWYVKVSDFGLAKNFEQAGFSGMTATRQIGGTLAFMPREQILHFRDLRPISDLWSLAATFYYLLTNRYVRDFPERADPIRIILDSPVVPIRSRDPAIPAPLAAVLDRALDDDPLKRPATAAELTALLRKL